MPPKKRDREVGEPQKNRVDHQVQADQELFLQAFEKPTQIYRFLKTRNRLSPMFLQRNLTYMKQRMSRSHKSRIGFKVDSLYLKLTKEKELENSAKKRIMSLTVQGFYDKKILPPTDPVKIETSLISVSHKKRKDVSTLVTEARYFASNVPINPPDDFVTPSDTITIHKDLFKDDDGQSTKTYMLLLKVHFPTNIGCYIPNGDAEEPAQKRRKMSNGTIVKPGCEETIYGVELVVFDKHNRCLLTDGIYDLVLQELNSTFKASPRKCSTWETIPDMSDCMGPLEIFNKAPTLKIKISWSAEQLGDGSIPPPLTHFPNHDNKENLSANSAGSELCVTNHNNNTMNGISVLSALATSSPSNLNMKINTLNGREKEELKSKPQIVYQFLYNNNSRQQTDASEDLHCPWCQIDGGRLYSLLKHFKLCHSRLLFTYSPMPNGARIDVALNEAFDGSYSGSPHELITQPLKASSTKPMPIRRTSVTNILVCRPKRTPQILSEFLELDENEIENQRPYITGHNRLYHHTVTMLPIYPKELDIDSEGENDPKWLQTKTKMMIDDFTDVNEGEKELMKMWNLHVMKDGYVGDCQIPVACSMFLEKKGKELLMKNLYRNFILHMCNLFDFNLISPVSFFQIIQKLQGIMKEEDKSGDIKKMLYNSHAAQVAHGVVTGSHLSTIKAAPGKINFTHENTHSNARRKMIPIGSPPSVSNKIHVHNGATKQHSSMMSSVPNKVNSSSVQNAANKNMNVSPSHSSNKSENQSRQLNGEGPVRRKSTNTNTPSSDSIVPSRRKSIISENGNNEYHKRKLILDAIPSSTNSVQKPQNGAYC